MTDSTVPRPRLLGFARHEVRAITLMAAIVLWALALVFWLAGSGYRSVAGPLKGGDFVFFYTLGAAARTGDMALLYDVDRLHVLQTQLVKESAAERYLPVYPPLVSLVYAPFSMLPFGAAATLWTLLTVGLYGGIVYTIRRHARGALPDGVFVAAAAAAFPPFWSLVLHAHNTAIPLLAFFAGWWALARGRRFLAGFCLGALFLKPPFGLALAVIVLVNFEWAMLAGLAASAALQVILTATVFDLAVLPQYAQFMAGVMRSEHLIEPQPFEMHSIRAMTRLLPDWLGTPLWLAASALVLRRTLIIWRHAPDATVKMGALVLASVLVSPHLFVYDATVLVLPILWVGAWLARGPDTAPLATRFWTVAFWLSVSFLIPLARIVLVQPSVFLMGWLLWMTADITAFGPSALRDRK